VNLNKVYRVQEQEAQLSLERTDRIACVRRPANMNFLLTYKNASVHSRPLPQNNL